MDQLTARKLLQRPRPGNSPRGSRKPMLSSMAAKGLIWSSSQNLNIPRSPFSNRRNSGNSQKESGSSVQNSPKLNRSNRDKKPRPRSMSDDRMNNDDDIFEAVALLASSKDRHVDDQCQIDLEEQTSAIV